MTTIRLHKFIANCGIASRRHSEGFIREGYVMVNDRVITEDGFLIDPSVDKVYFQGKLLKPEARQYYLVYKPKGYVCTNVQFQEPRVIDLIKTKQRLYTVGRLDKDSEGLIIVTNDGEVCQRISHPSFQVSKTYFIVIRGYIPGEIMEKVQQGIWLSEGKTGRVKLRVLKRARDFTSLLITLTEGKNREVRRIFARFGFKAKQLQRVSIGGLRIGNLKPGQYRQISYRDMEANVLNYTRPDKQTVL